jgi:hypothetical protein
MFYIAGSGLLLLCVSQTLLPYLSFTRRLQDVVQIYSALAYALDRITTDLQKAPSDTSFWKLCEKSGMVWSRQSLDYGWFLERDRLVRYEGNYSQGEWHNFTKTTVLIAIQALNFDYLYEGKRVKGIVVTLTTVQGTLQKYVRFFHKRVMQCNLS